jgi:hypothetical protein
MLLLLSATHGAHTPAGVFDVADMQLLLRWLDMLARNPKGTDDVKAVTGVLPPVQKLVLQLLGQLNMVSEDLVLALIHSSLACLCVVCFGSKCLVACLARAPLMACSCMRVALAAVSCWLC